MVHDFGVEYLAPKAHELDSNNRFPVESIPRLAEQGLMGVGYPEQYGGSGAGLVAEVIVVEEVAYSWAATASILTAHYLGLDGIFLRGTEEQKQQFLVPACRGEQLAAFCLTEPGAGSDVLSGTTMATKSGEHYVLNGTKHFISNGAYADFLVVYATTDRSKGGHGMSAFIVEKGTPGLSYGAGDDKMGIRVLVPMKSYFKTVEFLKAIS